MCDRTPSERTIEVDNIASFSCDFDLFWQPVLYTANNAPDGCPTSFPGGKVVSDVAIFSKGINSLDRIFNANGDLLFGTKIEFRRRSIPEPSTIFGLLVFGFSLAIFRKVSSN